MLNVQITPPRVPLIDARTGLIDRAWYMFFTSLFQNVTVLTDIQDTQSTESLVASYDAAIAALANDVGSRPASETIAQSDVPVPMVEPYVARDTPAPTVEQYTPQDTPVPAIEQYIPQDDLTPATPYASAGELTGPIAASNGVTSVTSQTGTGTTFVMNTSPTLVTPLLGTPASGTLTNCTGLPAAGVNGTALVAAAIGTTVQAYDADLTTWAGITPGTGVATALATNVGTAGALVANGGALGTPSSGTVTNLTGTASININGTVGATTPAAVTATTLTSTGNAALGDAEATDTHAVKGATTVLANSASAALTVTQTGAGNALVVEDSTSADATAFIIDQFGVVLVGPITFRNNFFNAAANTKVQVEGTDITTSSVSIVRNGSTTPAAAPYFVLGRTNGSTVGSTTVVTSGMMLGALSYQGSDGTEFVEAASIQAYVDGTPGANDMPGRLEFYTTADGSATSTLRMTISSAGVVTLTGSFVSPTVKASNAAGFISSDGSTGYTGTVTSASLVGKTITIKDGIITGFA